MTQWLLEEASFALLEAADARAEHAAMEAAESGARLRQMAMRQIGAG